MLSGDVREGPAEASHSWGSGGVSVVIPSYRGPSALASTLGSLAEQTVDRRRLEVVAVVNGPVAANRAAFHDLRRHIALARLRYVFTSTAGASLAWNLGIQAARMEWLTFLDDDDTVTPGYLERLLELAEPGVVPLAEIHDCSPSGALESGTPLNTMIRRHAGTTVSARELPQALGFNAAKLLPTRWAKEAAYDRTMTNGQDVAFFGGISQAHDITFAVVGENAGAAYIRGLSDTSMSRQAPTFEFSIEQRLHVIEALDRAQRTSTGNRRPVAQHLIAAQVHLMNRFVVDHPGRRRDVVASVSARRLSTFPYDSLNRDLATRLVIVADAVVEPRRIATDLVRLVAEWDEPVDVVAVSRTKPSHSWIAHFWDRDQIRHLQGRVARVEVPIGQTTTALGPIYEASSSYRDVITLTKHGNDIASAVADRNPAIRRSARSRWRNRAKQ